MPSRMPKTLSADDIQQFREAMRGVAENAFATRGAQGVTMRELAKELGCSAMTPYRYFRDKDEILAMVRAAAFNRFAARLEAAALKRSRRNRSRRAERRLRRVRPRRTARVPADVRSDSTGRRATRNSPPRRNVRGACSADALRAARRGGHSGGRSALDRLRVLGESARLHHAGARQPVADATGAADRRRQHADTRGRVRPDSPHVVARRAGIACRATSG